LETAIRNIWIEIPTVQIIFRTFIDQFPSVWTK
jgi:hypothetical protein